MADAHVGTANFFNAPSFAARRHYREGRQKWEVLYQPQGSSAPPSAARKGNHYRVGQSNDTFHFRQGSSRGWGKGRGTHRGVRGGHSLTLSSTNPVQGMEVDGAPGSTMAGVKEGVGTPAACSNNREGKGGTPSQGTRGKILLNGWPPP